MTVPVYKVLLVGDPNVGKSSLIRRLLLGEFDEDYHATIGVDLSAAAMNIDGSSPVILTLIDLGGQDDFGSLRTQYYKDAHYSLFVYDVTCRDSFESLPGWFEGMKIALKKKLPGMLIGNKKDMGSKRVVLQSEGRKYANSLDWYFLETSAKTGENVEDVFNRIAKELYTIKPPVKIKKESD